MNYLLYTTKDGDRWDLIAWDQYGDPMLYNVIVYANPGVSPVPVLTGGIQLRIPILDLQTEHSAWEPWA